MIPRIDLLYDDERRYQGPVSSKFLVTVTACTLIAVLALTLARTAFRAVMLGRDLVNEQARWTNLKPRHDQYKAMKTSRETLVRYTGELNGWRSSRLGAGALLDELQRKVPESVVLQRLDLRDDLGIQKPGAQTGTNTPDLVRSFRLRISGRAHGQKAEGEVSAFIQRSRDPASGGAVFRSMTLLSMQAQSGPAQDDSTASSFDIDSAGVERLVR